MKAQDRYLLFVRWSDEDQLYVGYCPDLFPAGGVCHGATSLEAYGKLCEIVEDTVKTARETVSHSMTLPEWTNPRGFEKDVFTFARIIFWCSLAVSPASI